MPNKSVLLNKKQDKQALFIEEDHLDVTVNIVITCILKRLRGINNKSASNLMLLELKIFYGLFYALLTMQPFSDDLDFFLIGFSY